MALLRTAALHLLLPEEKIRRNQQQHQEPEMKMTNPEKRTGFGRFTDNMTFLVGKVIPIISDPGPECGGYNGY